jgi:hydroxyethylthiazole kinase
MGEQMSALAAQTAQNLLKIRENKPLIHNITNYVVMNFTANVLLAAGASPVMAHAENEVEEMVGFAGSLVLNIGTLSDSWIGSMIKAGKKAAELGTPIILDPVGAGATALRTRTASEIIDQAGATIIRGNSSEILSLGSSVAETKGVDAVHGVEEAEATARKLATELDAVLAITGPVDIVTDGARTVRIANGHQMMPLVTGTGCSATALMGAFAAVEPDPVVAAAGALAFFGLAGEKAGETATGPGSFVVALLDALFTLGAEEVAEGSLFVEV